MKKCRNYVLPYCIWPYFYLKVITMLTTHDGVIQTLLPVVRAVALLTTTSDEENTKFKVYISSLTRHRVTVDLNIFKWIKFLSYIPYYFVFLFPFFSYLFFKFLNFIFILFYFILFYFILFYFILFYFISIFNSIKIKGFSWEKILPIFPIIRGCQGVWKSIVINGLSCFRLLKNSSLMSSFVERDVFLPKSSPFSFST